MTNAEPPLLTTAEHITQLGVQGELLAAAAGQLSLDAPVPPCPGWQVRDLLRHLGYVHRWATGYVTGRQVTPVAALDEAGVLDQPIPDGSLLDWFRTGHADLVSALQHADPDLACWTFLPGAASPLSFWARRQAHETAIHRADVQAAAGPGQPAGPFPDALAADGIDELLLGFARRNAAAGRGPAADPPRTLHIDAGGAGQWLIRMGPDRAELSRCAGAAPPAPADCSVSGPPSELYLLLWNRRGPAGLDVRGDRGVLEQWRQGVRVRWN